MAVLAFRRTLERFLVCILAAAALSACGPSGPKFQNTDITGSEFGKDFALTDHNGKPRTLADFKGKVVLLFFGFTHCPDVCPTTLSQLKAVKAALGKEGERMQVLFVTLDPERDSAELLREFVPAFDPSFLGLRGDAHATERVAREFKVYYKKVPTQGGDYTLDHSTATYAFDTAGNLRLYIRPDASVDAIAADVRTLLAEPAASGGTD